jgi:hypothetical protein
MWNYKTARVVAEIIQKAVREKWGYNVCVYGSVLYKGHSYNDLDIQLIPAAQTDNHGECNKVAIDVAESLGGVVTGSLNLNSIGEMCYLIGFNIGEEFKRIDMIIRRIVPYRPTDEEILAAARRVHEKRDILSYCKTESNPPPQQNPKKLTNKSQTWNY